MTEKEKTRLREKCLKLMKEVRDMSDDIIERQKEISPENPPTADFHATISLMEHRKKEVLKLEAQLREKH